MIVQPWATPILALTKEERLVLWVGVLAAVLVVGAMFIARLDRWRKRQMEHQDDVADHLGSFRSMFERGELSKEEYERVLRKMAERAGAKPKPAPATPPPAESPAPEEPPAAPPA